MLEVWQCLAMSGNVWQCLAMSYVPVPVANVLPYVLMPVVPVPVQLSGMLSKFEAIEAIQNMQQTPEDAGRADGPAFATLAALRERERAALDRKCTALQAELEAGRQGAVQLQARLAALQAELDVSARGKALHEGRCKELENKELQVRARTDYILGSLFASLVDMSFDIHPASLVSMARIAFDLGLSDSDVTLVHHRNMTSRAVMTKLDEVLKTQAALTDIGTRTLCLLGSAIRDGYSAAESKLAQHKRAIESHRFDGQYTVVEILKAEVMRAFCNSGDVKFLYITSLAHGINVREGLLKIDRLEAELALPALGGCRMPQRNAANAAAAGNGTGHRYP